MIHSQNRCRLSNAVCLADLARGNAARRWSNILQSINLEKKYHFSTSTIWLVGFPSESIEPEYNKDTVGARPIEITKCAPKLRKTSNWNAGVKLRCKQCHTALTPFVFSSRVCKTEVKIDRASAAPSFWRPVRRCPDTGDRARGLEKKNNKVTNGKMHQK